MQLEFEHTYFEAGVQHLSYYTMGLILYTFKYSYQILIIKWFQIAIPI